MHALPAINTTDPQQEAEEEEGYDDEETDSTDDPLSAAHETEDTTVTSKVRFMYEYHEGQMSKGINADRRAQLEASVW